MPGSRCGKRLVVLVAAVASAAAARGNGTAATFAPTGVPTCVDTLAEVTSADTGGVTSYTCAEVFQFGYVCGGEAFGYEVLEHCCFSCSLVESEGPLTNGTNATNATALGAGGGGGGGSGGVFSLINFSVVAGAVCVLLALFLCLPLCGWAQRRLRAKLDERCEGALGPPTNLLVERLTVRYRVRHALTGRAALRRCCCWSTYRPPVRRDDYLGTKYADMKGEVHAAFCELGISRDADRLRWLRLWQDLDADDDRFVEFEQFADFFDLDCDDAWCERAFQTLCSNIGLRCTLQDFIRGSHAACALDRASSRRFAFRLLSQQCAALDEATTVLDASDFRFFIAETYGETTTARAVAKRAKQLCQYFADLNGTTKGHLDLEHFNAFAETNETFVALGHVYQCRLRDRILGEEYWDKWAKKQHRRQKATWKKKKENTKKKDSPESSSYKRDHADAKSLDAFVRGRGFGEDCAEGEPRSLWIDFPEVFSHLDQRRLVAEQTYLDSVHNATNLSDAVFARLLRAMEDLASDTSTVAGCFQKWGIHVRRDRSAEAAALRLAVPDRPGVNSNVHRQIIVTTTTRVTQPATAIALDTVVEHYTARIHAWTPSAEESANVAVKHPRDGGIGTASSSKGRAATAHGGNQGTTPSYYSRSQTPSKPGSASSRPPSASLPGPGTAPRLFPGAPVLSRPGTAASTSSFTGNDSARRPSLHRPPSSRAAATVYVANHLDDAVP